MYRQPMDSSFPSRRSGHVLRRMLALSLTLGSITGCGGGQPPQIQPPPIASGNATGLHMRDPCEDHLLGLYRLTGDLRLPRPLRPGEAAHFDTCSGPPPADDSAQWSARTYWATRLAGGTLAPRDTHHQQLLEGLWHGYAEDVARFFEHHTRLPPPRLASSFSVPGVDEGRVASAPVIFDFGVVAVAVDRMLDGTTAPARGVNLAQHRHSGAAGQHERALQALATQQQHLDPAQCLASELGAILLVDLLDAPVRRQAYLRLCGHPEIALAWQVVLDQRDLIGPQEAVRQACQREFDQLAVTMLPQAERDENQPPPLAGAPLPLRLWFEAISAADTTGSGPGVRSRNLSEIACSGLHHLPFADTRFLHGLVRASAAAPGAGP